MRLVTLGPEGSCHENAAAHYLQFHGIRDYRIIFVDDILAGLEMVREGQADQLLQCSAHLTVHLVTEKYRQEIFVTDTFIFPTREMVILERQDIAKPGSLGLPKPTEGYLDDLSYPELVYETTKPVVGRNLLAGKYHAGLTTLNYHTDNPGRFRIRKYIGKVLTTWLVYSRENCYRGQPMGVLPKGAWQPDQTPPETRLRPEYVDL
ncbi:MAG: hypothetical protein QNK37_19075 [Acidobacteriota bacterium]|nr:hypothetical protein [Acidobacteriota bacterium]